MVTLYQTFCNKRGKNTHRVEEGAGPCERRDTCWSKVKVFLQGMVPAEGKAESL